MRKNIFVLEIWGFQAPVPTTLRLAWGEIHIIPANIYEVLRAFRATQMKLEIPGQQVYQTEEFESAVSSTNASSFIIFESQNDYKRTPEEIGREVLNWCSVLIDVHSFAFEAEIQIVSIYCFQRIDTIMKLKRVLSRAYHPLFPEYGKKIWTGEGYEEFLTQILQDRKNIIMERYGGLISEYLHFIRASNTLETIIMGWNFLEHLTNFYWANQRTNLLIDDKKFDQLRVHLLELVKNYLEKEKSLLLNLDSILENVNHILNDANTKSEKPLAKNSIKLLKQDIRNLISTQVQEQDIMIQGYSREEISKIIADKIDNFPGILTSIYNLCDKMGRPLTPDEKETIQLMYIARNKCFHNTPNISAIIEELATIEKVTPEGKILRNLLKKYKDLLRAIIWHMFGWPRDTFKQTDLNFTMRVFQQKEEAGNFFILLKTKFLKNHRFLPLATFLSHRRKEWGEKFPLQLSGTYIGLENSMRRIQVEFNGYVPQYARGEVEQVISRAYFIIKDRHCFDSLLVFEFSFITESILQMKIRIDTEILDFQIGVIDRIKYIKKEHGDIARAIEDAVTFQASKDDIEGPVHVGISIKDNPPNPKKEKQDQNQINRVT